MYLLTVALSDHKSACLMVKLHMNELYINSYPAIKMTNAMESVYNDAVTKSKSQ